MNAVQKQRLVLVLLMVLGIAIAIGLALYALQQNINLFYTPSQVKSGVVPKAHSFRIGGMVRKGSLQHAKNNLNVNFLLTDYVEDVPIQYSGVLPDLFREGQGVVVQGKLSPQGIFLADEVLAKHDEKYMPPPVTDALQQARKNRKL